MARSALPVRGPIQVRSATGADEELTAGEVTVAAYEEFRTRFSPEDWEVYARTLPDTAVRVAQGELLVATDADGEIVGTVTYYVQPQPTSGHWRAEDAMVRFLAVRPDRRGEGIGAALIDECLRRATNAGKLRLAMQTTASMATAIGMYERRGFARDPDGDMVAGSFDLRGYAKPLGGSPAGWHGGT